MCALRLPEEAPDVLNRDWPSGVRKSAPSKWLIYCTDSVPQQAKGMYHAAMEANVDNGAMLDQATRDESNFLKLAKQDFSAPNVQHILDHHLRTLDQLFAHPQQTSSEDWETYFYGFIVVTGADWREQGVTAVHCDEDRGKWKVTTCNIPVHELAELYSVMQLDISFDEVRENFDSDENQGLDSQGGPAPVGEWQFAVYCTGTIGKVGFLRTQVQEMIPDPRGDVSYPEGEACLWFLPKESSAECINEDWPLEYAKFVKDPEIDSTGVQFICKRHPSLFVHIHDADPSVISIVKMDWDHNVERSNEELKKIGRESKTTSRLCEADVLVTTLLKMADEESIGSIAKLQLTTE